MPPLQPDNLAPQAPPTNQYDFIVNAGKRGPVTILPSVNNSSLKTRLLVAGAGALVLIVLFWVFIALISSSSSSSTAPLISLAQQQNEIARVSTESAQDAVLPTTQTFAITTSLSLLSEQRAFLAYLRSLGSVPASSILQATRNSKTDATLKSALSNGNYDQAYIAITQSELASYEHNLKQVFADTKVVKERQLLQVAYQQAQLLVQQGNQTE
jgi:hypothetical protein